MKINMKTETRFGVINDGNNMETKPRFEAIKDRDPYGDRDWIQGHRTKFESLNFCLWTLKNLPEIGKIIQKVRDKHVEYISINSGYQLLWLCNFEHWAWFAMHIHVYQI